MDAEITAFFERQRDKWLKKKTNTSMSDEELIETRRMCDAEFAIATWLPKAAARAHHISISTHPCKFSHPSAQKNKNGNVSSIIASSSANNDGYLRSGNVKVPLDAVGSAAALDVHTFLTLKMEDGQTLLNHIEQETTLARTLLTLPNPSEKESYKELRVKFLKMMESNPQSVTSAKIKQVYFPIDHSDKTSSNKSPNYHLLSILTASGILFELKKRLNDMRFGDEVKAAREHKKNGLQHSGYREIYGLTTIGFGGAQPQNISVLNSKYYGKADVLMCAPPQLVQRDSHFPTQDFFSQTVNYYQCKEQFNALHRIYRNTKNNQAIRNQRLGTYQSIIDYVIQKMWQSRIIALNQYNKTSSKLPMRQRIWLCEQQEYKTQRQDSDVWITDIMSSIARFIFHGYDKVMRKQAIKMGSAEYEEILSTVKLNIEALR